MNGGQRALWAELMKLRHASILWTTFIAFALGPIMGGVLLFLMQHSESIGQSGMLKMKTEMMDFKADWNSYFMVLSQVVGVGGVLVFGFVASWLFGREFSDSTTKDLLALPTSRSQIINAKFRVYLFWSLSLVISNLFLGGIIGNLIGLNDFDMAVLPSFLKTYAVTTLMVLALGAPISFFALWGKGYMAPIAFVALTLVISQIVAAIGFGHYFPWALPGLYSGAGGEYKASINNWSYTLLAFTTLAGYLATHFWWNTRDQH